MGLTQAQLATALHRPIDTIQNWEQGRRAIEWPSGLRFLLTALDRERTLYGADREGFLASLPTFLTRDRPAAIDTGASTMDATINDAYDEFERMHDREHPVRTRDDLRDLIHAADLRYEEIDGAFWGLAFGDVGDDESWAGGQLDWPSDGQWARFERERQP